jgi:hypothetical protein
MNTATVFLAAFFAAGTAWGKWAEDYANPKTPDGEPLVVETFPVQPTGGCGWRPDLWDSSEKRDENDREWRELLAKFGISWPEGSYVCHVPAFDALVIRNTQDNLEKVRVVLGPCEFPLRIIRVQTSLWLVEPKAALELGLDDGSGILSPEEWTALRARLAAHDGVEFLANPTAQLKNGIEASVKGVSECTYPTEFSIVAGSDGAFAVEPNSFQTREVGEVLDIIAFVTEDGSLIDLTFAITSVREPSWREWSDSLPPLQQGDDATKRTLSIRTPDFPCASIQTSMNVLPGIVYRLGGAPLVEPGRGRRLFFAFLSAEETDPKPTIPLNLPAPESSEVPIP